MRQILRLNEKLTEVGMYAKVRIKTVGREVDGILARLSNTRLCFASNSDYFMGTNKFREYSDWNWVRDEYRFGWSIIAEHCGDFSFESICSQEGFNYEDEIFFVGLFVGGDVLCLASGETAIVQEEQREHDFFSDLYQKEITYKGVHGYHYHHGVTQNKPITVKRGHKIGVELEVEFNTSSGKTTFSENVRSNWFYCERDGSLNERGVELITVPMLPKDIKSRKTWGKLIGFLADKAKSWDSSRCGLHVHIGREILGSNAEQQSETIGKLLFLYHHHVNGTAMNTKIFGRERAYNEKDGKTTEGNAVATLGSSVLKLKEIKDKLKSGLVTRTKSDRYFDINLQNNNTIEFRKGRGSIKTSRIIMVIEYCEMMCKYAKSAKWDEISKENFVEYIVNKISKESPLYQFFEAGERCEYNY